MQAAGSGRQLSDSVVAIIPRLWQEEDSPKDGLSSVSRSPSTCTISRGPEITTVPPAAWIVVIFSSGAFHSLIAVIGFRLGIMRGARRNKDDLSSATAEQSNEVLIPSVTLVKVVKEPFSGLVDNVNGTVIISPVDSGHR